MRHEKALLRPAMAAMAMFALLLCAVPAHGQRATTHLDGHLPKDPLMAISLRENPPGEIYDNLVALTRVLLKDDPSDLKEVEDGLAGIDRALGLSLRSDLLGALGPEQAFYLDLPPIDRLAGAAASPGATPADLLKNIDTCILLSTPKPQLLESVLRKMATSAGARITAQGEIVRFHFDATSPNDRVDLYHAIRNGVLAISLSPDAVRSALRPRPYGQRIADGRDYRQVFQHLDPDAVQWVYINLPKIRRLMQESQVLQGFLSGEPAARRLFDQFINSRQLPMGLGTTVVRVGQGVRQTSFGPPLFSSLGLAKGFPLMMASVAVPNLLNATNRGRQMRTMADMRTVATAMEEYDVDYARYPSTGNRWVQAADLAPKLSPVYIKHLPETDGWGHPFRCWSDGRSYVIVSPGEDGVLDRDWLKETTRRKTINFDDDIVFKDGSFLQWPEGTMID